jgi:ubiquinone/menaquinone biosynthesis C-methylase UbiE
MKDFYVHGYSSRESLRLQDQARTLEEILHRDTEYATGSRVLEAGCGVGAQTVILSRTSPGAEIISMDLSPASIRLARESARQERISNVRFLLGDIFHPPFPEGSFDHIFVCFVLEHLARPQTALQSLRRILKEGGTITVIEGDHGSAFFHPEDHRAREAIGCLVKLQRQAGGNALIGRELYPLVSSAGFRKVSVSPRMVYVDSSRPELVEGFTRNTFTAMVEGVEKEVLHRGMMDRASWRKGIEALHRTSEADGVFCYTFFKATAVK